MKKANVGPVIIVALAFALPFFFFLTTLTPTTTFGDSGEFLALPSVLGIGHPPGFPLFILLSRVFLFLPFGDEALRITLMSAFFGALTSVVLTLTLRHLTQKWLFSFGLALLFCTSSIFWEQAVKAEVYTLNAFFVSLLLSIGLLWTQDRDPKKLLMASFFVGLATTNHPMIVLLAMAFPLVVVSKQPAIMKQPRLIIFCLLLVIAGGLVYLYLPIRAAAHPLIAWGEPSTLPAVMNHITRGDYGLFEQTTSVTGTEIVRAVFHFLTLFFEVVTRYLTFPLVALGLFGGLRLFVKNRPLGYLTLGSALLSVLGLTLVSGLLPSEDVEKAYEIFFLQSMIPFLLAVGVGANELIDRLLHHSRLVQWRKNIAISFVGLLVIVILTPIPSRFVELDHSQDWLLERYLTETLESLEPGSVLAFRNNTLVDDGITLSFLYLHTVEKIRSDVLIVSPGRFFADPEVLRKYYPTSILMDGHLRDTLFVRSLLSSETIRGRPLYSFDPYAHTGLVFPRSTGLLYRLFATREGAESYQRPKAIPRYDALLPDLPERLLSNEERYVLASYYYARALAFHEQGRRQQAGHTLQLAIFTDPEPLSALYRKFLNARQLNIQQQGDTES